MKIITNKKLITRNNKIGKFLTLAAIGVLGVGFYISVSKPELALWSYVALIFGYLLSQIGIYFVNRWGTSPRPDEKIVKALKGLPGDYTLYNYMLPIPHVLVGPAGVWTLEVFHQRGEITFNEQKNRWKQSKVNLFLKIFSQEGLGNPEKIVADHKKEMEKILTDVFNENTPPVNSVLVFTDERTRVDAQNAPIPTLSIDKLKDFFRRSSKENPISAEQLDRIKKTFPEI